MNRTKQVLHGDGHNSDPHRLIGKTITQVRVEKCVDGDRLVLSFGRGVDGDDLDVRSEHLFY